MIVTIASSSSYYPQIYGKIERWHQSLKREFIRHRILFVLDDARTLVEEFAVYYITKHFLRTIGYSAPKDKPEER